MLEGAAISIRTLLCATKRRMLCGERMIEVMMQLLCFGTFRHHKFSTKDTVPEATGNTKTILGIPPMVSDVIGLQLAIVPRETDEQSTKET